MTMEETAVLGKVEILSRLEHAYTRLDTTLAPLSWAKMVEPGVTGYWSVKDIVAHLIYWNRHPVTELETALNGDSVAANGHKDIDRINAEAVLAYRNCSIEETLTAFQESYQAVHEIIATLPDSAFEPDADITIRLGDTIEGAFANNTYDHYVLHEAQIHDWANRMKVE